jgi:beta-barrel assembly-enhancing protease
MKHRIAFSGVMLLTMAAIVVSERRTLDVPPTPAPLLYLIADTEQELTRMPVRFTRMSDEDEIRIGNELAHFYARNAVRDSTSETQIVDHYVTRVGEQVAANAHRRLPYKFHYLPGPYLINAFALPGGHVYVGGGLLALMDSEDELATVLGHEIEHIDHYDCAERVQREQALRKVPLGALFAIPVEVFEAGYSKDQELQADRDGTRLAVEAGYSANAAIRMFETLARLYRDYDAKAKTPQEELSRLTEQALEGYFRSHPLPSERIAQIQKLIASEGWTAHPERDLVVAYIFWTAKSQNALRVRNYPQAEQLALQSLHLRADQPKTLQVLALAQFAQANFSGAAEAYRKILEIDKTSPSEIIAAYARSLAAADRGTALARFESWAEGVDGGKPREVAVSAAGLELLNGAPDAARRLESESEQSSELFAPLWMGELAWWHYLAGDYQKSVELSSAAQQLRPRDGTVTLHLGWGLVEVRRYADALRILESSSFDPATHSENAMARAVAYWRTQEKDAAIVEFNRALAGQPEWGNSDWVRALYSPQVAQSVQEMQVEREQRKQKAKVISKRTDPPIGRIRGRTQSEGKFYRESVTRRKPAHVSPFWSREKGRPLGAGLDFNQPINPQDEDGADDGPRRYFCHAADRDRGIDRRDLRRRN